MNTHTSSSTRPVLYTATDLSHWVSNNDESFSNAVIICGITFYKLEPGVYAWIHHRMGLAKRAYENKKIKFSAWNILQKRFNVIHRWTIKRFGKTALLASISTFDPKAHKSPCTSTEPGQESTETIKTLPRPEIQSPRLHRKIYDAREFAHHVSPEAVAQVMAIRKKALSLNWSEQKLLGNTGRFGFPCGDDWGLVCFIEHGMRIGKITRQAIEIIQRTGHSLRFYNPDVEQPWFSKKGERPCAKQ